MGNKKLEAVALTPEGRELAAQNIPRWAEIPPARQDELALQWLRKEARPSHGRMGVALEDGVATVSTPSDKDVGSYAVTLYETFATKSGEFLECRILEIVNLLSSYKAATESNVNGLVAFIGGCAPEDEQQAGMATQMALTQFSANRALSLAAGADTLEKFVAYTNAATKLGRTFVAQTEAYSKLQRGGVQTVKHVNVYEGGQAVVADTVHTGGSHVRSSNPAHATGVGASMLGHDAQGFGVPVPGCEGQEAVPDARRGER